MLATIRSHDQFNTTIYSNDDRYRGLKGLRAVVFMNEDDMRDRGLSEFDLIDVTSFSKDGSTRTVHGYRAVQYEIPPGNGAGYMPELNVLCGIARWRHGRPSLLRGRRCCEKAGAGWPWWTLQAGCSACSASNGTGRVLF